MERTLDAQQLVPIAVLALLALLLLPSALAPIPATVVADTQPSVTIYGYGTTSTVAPGNTENAGISLSATVDLPVVVDFSFFDSQNVQAFDSSQNIALHANQGASVQVTWTVPLTQTPGSYYIVVRALDPTRTIQYAGIEGNRQFGCYCFSIVSPPTPTPSVTPIPTSTPYPTYTPKPTYTPYPTQTAVPPIGPPLAVYMPQRTVMSGDVLTIQLKTAPRARVRITLQVKAAHNGSAGTGHNQKRTKGSVVLYQAARQGIADVHGRFMAHMHVTYKPAKSVQAFLVVTVRTGQHSATRILRVTIQPKRRHRLGA